MEQKPEEIKNENENENKEIVVVPEVKPKKKFNFKEYYHANPEFKKSHLAKLKQKVTCEVCNKTISKCHIDRHRKTKKHLKLMGVVVKDIVVQI